MSARPRRPPRRLVALLLALALLLPALALAPPARAAAIVVTGGGDTVANDRVCTLREAVVAANTDAASGRAPGECAAGEAGGQDAITFKPGLGAIALTRQLPDVTTALAIQGPGPGQLTIGGDDTFRLLVIAAPGRAVALGGLTLTCGHATAAYGGDLIIDDGIVAVTGVALTAGTAGPALGGAGALSWLLSPSAA